MLRNQSIAQNVSSYTDAAVLSMTCPNGMNPVEEAGTVEHDNEEVKDATLATVTAASKLGEVHLLVAGAGCAGVADEAAKIAGVGKVHLADDAAYKDFIG